MGEYIYIMKCKKCKKVGGSEFPFKQKRPKCYNCSSTSVTIKKINGLIGE